MNRLRSSLATFAACGLLFAATVPAFAAKPNDYQITGTVTALTDTTMTIVTLQKQNWDFARSADTKLPEGAKIGDKVTVHYTMTAATVDAKPDAAAKKAAAPAKTSKKAKDEAATPAAAASPKP